MGYMGAKSGSGVFQIICALMPPHETYLELFAGTGAVLKRKAAAFQSFALDLDPAMVGQLAHLPGVVAIAGCAFEFLETFDVRHKGRVVVYADPPYVLATRTSARRYPHDFTDQDHHRLAAALHELGTAGAAVIVSGYPSALYDELYAGWNTREFQAMTRRGARTEKLWFNFAPGASHQATFAGRDFTERQRIKRKAARWATRFAALPPAERQAVLAAVLEAGDHAQSEPAMVASSAGIVSPDCATRSAGDIVSRDYGRRRRP